MWADVIQLVNFGRSTCKIFWDFVGLGGLHWIFEPLIQSMVCFGVKRLEEGRRDGFTELMTRHGLKCIGKDSMYKRGLMTWCPGWVFAGGWGLCLIVCENLTEYLWMGRMCYVLCI